MDLKAGSIAGHAMAVLALGVLVFRESLFAVGVVAIAVQVFSALLMLWARLTFGRRSFHAAANPTEGGLVTSGPYYYIRHPIYAAIIYFLWAGIFTHFSPIDVFLGLFATFGLVLRVIAEERLVAQRYPAYLDYASRTKRILPFVL